MREKKLSQPARPDATSRFSNRVENYVRYRPRYPKQVVEVLEIEGVLKPQSVIADIGSGTGFLAELFLTSGYQVTGVEPNQEMRKAGDRLLQKFPAFKSIAATAEDTSLLDESIDVVTAGQAFHWFDRKRCRTEFRRILRPGGWVVLVWNDRRTDSTPFLVQYEELLQTYGTDYAQVDHKQIDLKILRQFFGAEPRQKTFPNYQYLDFEGLKGRVLSSSYVPASGDPGHDEMLKALASLYEAYQRNDQVTLEYNTLLYYGQLI